MKGGVLANRSQPSYLKTWAFQTAGFLAVNSPLNLFSRFMSPANFILFDLIAWPGRTHDLIRQGFIPKSVIEAGLYMSYSLNSIGRIQGLYRDYCRGF